MPNRPAFGRRVAGRPLQASLAERPQRQASSPAIAVNDSEDRQSLPEPRPPAPSIEDELREWKQTRKAYSLPWKQLSFTASVCFGVAGLVLPDSVNSVVDWMLYALAAASLYVGFKARRQKRSQPPDPTKSGGDLYRNSFSSQP
ncbi:MAG: hypothetical protein JOZ13_08055 [Alphaproteobacteria bacterium]|nr:hypothetical protein [Alphaproteobacteria bacterium]